MNSSNGGGDGGAAVRNGVAAVVSYDLDSDLSRFLPMVSARLPPPAGAPHALSSSSSSSLSSCSVGGPAAAAAAAAAAPLPPQLHPSSGLVPANWEEFPVDPSIPDVSDWSPAQISAHLSGQGFPLHLADVFQREEIDGRSLMLLRRQDVIGSLGLRLGPALKVFKCIRRLQTRRNFPNN